MGNFPQHFLQDFPARFPARFFRKISHKIFPRDFPQDFSARFSARFSRKISCRIFPQDFPQDFPARILHNIFPQDFPATFSHKIFPQDFPTTISRKIFPSWILIGWLPITLFQMLNFHQSLSFLNWLFPSSISHVRVSRKIFLQQFPTTISHNNFPQDFPELDTDWLAPHHPFPNDKFPPITASGVFA